MHRKKIYFEKFFFQSKKIIYDFTQNFLLVKKLILQRKKNFLCEK